MDDKGEVRDDLDLPQNELGKEIKERFNNEEQLLVSVASERILFPYLPILVWRPPRVIIGNSAECQTQIIPTMRCLIRISIVCKF